MGTIALIRGQAGSKFNAMVTLLLALAMIVCMIPRDILDFRLEVEIERPLFTDIPTLPLAVNEAHSSGVSNEQQNQEDNIGTNGDGYVSDSENIDGERGISTSILPLMIVSRDLGGRIHASEAVINSAENKNLPLFLVKFRPGTTMEQVQVFADECGLLVDGQVPGTNIFKISSPGADDIGNVIQELKSGELVTSVQQDQRYGPTIAATTLSSVSDSLRNKVIPLVAEELNVDKAETGQDTEIFDRTHMPDIQSSGSTSGQTIVNTNSEDVSAIFNSTVGISEDSITGETETTTSVETLQDMTNDESLVNTSSVASPSGVEAEPVLATESDLAVSDETVDKSQVHGNTYVATESIYEDNSGESADLNKIQDVNMDIPDKAVNGQTGNLVSTMEPVVSSTEVVKNVAVVEDVATVDDVPIMAVGSVDEPVEYTSSIGDVSVRYSIDVSQGESMISVSNGDKGFTIGYQAENTSENSQIPIVLQGNSISYTDDVSGSQLLLTPNAESIYAELVMKSASGTILTMPTFGLFGELNDEGIIVLIDSENGGEIFEVVPGVTTMEGNVVSGTNLSLSEVDGIMRIHVEPGVEPRTGSSNSGEFHTNRFLPVVASFSIRDISNSGVKLQNVGGTIGDYSIEIGERVHGNDLASVEMEEGKMYFGSGAIRGSETVRHAFPRGNYSYYPDAAGGAGLRFKEIDGGMEQEIVLHQVPTINVFDMPISADSLFFSMDEQGAVSIKNMDGETVAHITADMMYDSRPASEGGQARSNDLELELVEDEYGNTLLRITANAEWLGDPARVYPVFIDPTLTFPVSKQLVPTSTPTFYWSYDGITPTKAQLVISRVPGVLVQTGVTETWINPYLKQVTTNYMMDFSGQAVFINEDVKSITRYPLPVSNALEDGIYYWRIYYETGSGGNWSSSREFVINTAHNASYYGQLPGNVVDGSVINVPITVKNRGSSTWLANGDDYALSYHLKWSDTEGYHDVFGGERTRLPFDLPPGHEIQMDAALQIPTLPVSDDNVQLTVEWDMLHEGICWFSERGEEPLKLQTIIQKSWNAETSVQYDALPKSVSPDSASSSFLVSVTNTGGITWSDMKVVARLYDISGREITENLWYRTYDNHLRDNYEETFFETGETGTAPIAIHAPEKPGVYQVRLDLYHGPPDNGYWMSDKGVKTVDFAMAVGANGILPRTAYLDIGSNANVNLVSGNLVISAVDIKSSGRGPPINISRSYNSQSSDSSYFGHGWSSTLDVRVDEATNQSVFYYTASGVVHEFIPAKDPFTQDLVMDTAGNYTYLRPPGTNLDLTKNSDDSTYSLLTLDGTQEMRFSSIGKLESIKDSNGNETVFNYDGTGKLSSVDDSGSLTWIKNNPTADPDANPERIIVNYEIDPVLGERVVSSIRIPSSASRGYSYRTYNYLDGNLVSTILDPSVDPDGSPNDEAVAIPHGYDYYSQADVDSGLTDSINLGKMKSQSVWMNEEAEISTIGMRYDDSGRLTLLVDPRSTNSEFGKSITYGYSGENAIVSITDALGGDIQYSLGSGLRILESVSSANGGGVILYEDFSGGNLDNWSVMSANVAYGKNVVASGQHVTASYGPEVFIPANIVDGSIQDIFSPTASDYWLLDGNEGWIEIDLGSSHIITGMNFMNTSNGDSCDRGTKDWHISISNDRNSYATVAQGRATDRAIFSWDPDNKSDVTQSFVPWVNVKMPPTQARYVRFDVDSCYGRGGGLSEFQVYGYPKDQELSDAFSVSNDPYGLDVEVMKIEVASGEEEIIVTHADYADFNFITSLYVTDDAAHGMEARDIGVIFRQSTTNTKIEPRSNNDSQGYYLFRASGVVDRYGNVAATLYKWEGQDLVVIASVPLSNVVFNAYHWIRIEAVGPHIQCFLDDLTTPIIDVYDWTYSRGKIGFRANGAKEWGVAAAGEYYVTIGVEDPMHLFGRARAIYAYDFEGRQIGIRDAYSASSKLYDSVERYSWSEQLPDERWSIRPDTDNTANNVLYGDDMYGPNIIWTGDYDWKNYTIQADVTILDAAMPDSFWSGGGNAGLVVRSKGDPENGYLLSIYPNSTDGIKLIKMISAAGGAELITPPGTDIDLNTTYRMVMKIDGGQIDIEIFSIDQPETPIFTSSVNDDSLIQGKVGLRINKARTIFDNVKISGQFGEIIRFDDFQSKGLLSAASTVDLVTGYVDGKTFTYDEQNRARSVTDKNKKRSTVTRDSAGNILLSADVSANMVINEYDDYGNITSSTTPILPVYNNVPNPECVEAQGDWEFLNSDQPFGSDVSWDNNIGHSDNSSLKFEYQTGNDTWVGAQSSVFAVEEGETYTVSAMVRTWIDGENQIGLGPHDRQNIYIRFFQDSERQVEVSQLGPKIPEAHETSTYDWQRIHKTVSVPEGAIFADIFVAIGNISYDGNPPENYNDSCVWVDEVQLERGAVVPSTNYVSNPHINDHDNGAPVKWTFDSDILQSSGSVGNDNSASPDIWNTSTLAEGWGVNNNGEMSVYFWDQRNGKDSTYLVTNDLLSSGNYQNHYIVESRINMVEGRDISLILNYQDDDNMYLVRGSGLDRDSAGDAILTFMKRIGGGLWETLDSVVIPQTYIPMIGSGDWYILTAEITLSTPQNDPQIDIEYSMESADGSLIASSTIIDDQNPLLQANNTISGTVGFRVGPGNIHNHHHLDDFSISRFDLQGQPEQITDHFNIQDNYLVVDHSNVGGTVAKSWWTQDLNIAQLDNTNAYTFSAQYRTHGLSETDLGAYLMVDWQLVDNSHIFEHSQYYKSDSEWSFMVMSLIPPSDAVKATIYLLSSSAQGSADFDDIHLTESIAHGSYSALGNGSFEIVKTETIPGGTDTATVATGWFYNDLKNWSEDTDIHKYGNRSLRVVAPDPSDDWAVKDVQVKANTEYILSGWIKTRAIQASTGEGALLYALFDGDCYMTVPVTGDSDWNLQLLRFRTGRNTNRVRIGLQKGNGGSTPGVAWFDGVQLVEKSVWLSTYGYDDNSDLLLKSIDPMGAVSELVRNRAGQITSSIKYEREQDGNLRAIISEKEYDNAGRLIQTLSPPNANDSIAETYIRYDKAGNKLSVTGPTGATTVYSYDLGGRVVFTEKPRRLLFADDFTNDSTNWSEYGPNTWQVTGGNYQCTVEGYDEAISLVSDSDWESFEFETDITVNNGTDSAGIVFHSDGGTGTELTLYYCGLYPAENKWKLYTVTDGYWNHDDPDNPHIEGDFELDFGEDYKLKILANGTYVSVYVDKMNDPVWNGTLHGQTSDGKAGILVFADAPGIRASFDNVEVNQLDITTSLYDNAGRLTSKIESTGSNTISTSYTYDSLGRNTSRYVTGNDQSSQLNQAYVYTYDETGKKLSEKDPSGNIKRHINDSSGVIATYDALGNITSTIITRGMDNLTLTSTIDAQGHISVSKSDSTGVVMTEDARLESVMNSYTAGGSLASRVDAGLDPYIFNYDARGMPGVYIDPLGNTLSFTRDDLGRLTRRTDARSMKQSFTYDDLGRVLTRIDTDGETIIYDWDVAGRLVTATNEDGTCIEYKYDDVGHILTSLHKDENSNVLYTIKYDYSQYGGLEKIQDILSETVSYSYDALGRLLNVGSSLYQTGAKMEITLYDNNGNILQKQDPDGTVENFTYDVENRITSYELLSPLGSVLEELSYTYDANGNILDAGKNEFTDDFSQQAAEWTTSDDSKWTTVRDQNNTDTYYQGDYLGDTLGNTAAAWRGDYSMSDYWLSARVTVTATDPGTYDPNIGYLHDASAGILLRSDGAENNLDMNHYYLGIYPDQDQWKIFKTLNGEWDIDHVKKGSITIDKNKSYKLSVRIDDSTIRFFIDDVLMGEYVDPDPIPSGRVGLRVRNATAWFDDVRQDSELTQYVYDEANQLISVINDDASYITYTYDKNGNRIQVDDNGYITRYSYDAANQLSKITDINGNIIDSYMYDENGNTILDDMQFTNADDVTYKYDERNRLTSVDSISDGSTNYTYNAGGRLTGRTSTPLFLEDTFEDWVSSAQGTWRNASDNGNNVFEGSYLDSASAAWHGGADMGSDYLLTASINITDTQQIDDGYGNLVPRADATAGVLIRSDGLTQGLDNNQYYFGIYPNQDQWKLFRKTVTGSWQLMEKATATIDLDTYYTLRIKANGDSITIWLGDQELATFDESAVSNKITSGHIGLRVRNSTAYFDDVKVEGLGSGKQLIFEDTFTSDWVSSTQGIWQENTDNGDPVFQGDRLAGASAAWWEDPNMGSDYLLSAKVKVTAMDPNTFNATAGVLARSDGLTHALDRNQYYFGIYPNQDLWKLFRKTTANGWVQLASDTAQIDMDIYYTLNIKANGDSITIWLDDQELATFDESTVADKISSGHIGLRVRNATAYFDDVRVEGFSDAQYIYNDTNGSLLHELDRDGNVIATYVSDEQGNPISVTRWTDGGQQLTYFYHYNQHGDVIAITDENGDVVATFTYDVWGVPTEYDPSGAIVEIGTWTLPTGGTPGDGLFFLFGGMLYDALAGLYLTRTRAYNPKTGRFLERDILDEKGKKGIYKGFPFGEDAIGTNLYAWCKNNPVNHIDPSGKWFVKWYNNLRARAALHRVSSFIRRLFTPRPSVPSSLSQLRNGWGSGGYYWQPQGRASYRQSSAIPKPAPKIVRPVVTTFKKLFKPASVQTKRTDPHIHVTNGDRVNAFAKGPGADLVPFVGPILSQGIASMEYEEGDKSFTETSDFFISTSLNLGEAADIKYAGLIGFGYDSIKFINYATSDPDDWTCMNCHQYQRDEIRKEFGLPYIKLY